MKLKFNELKKRIFKGGFKMILPSYYLAALLFGLLLSFIYMFLPFLSVCPTLFEQKVCAPVGVYFALFASLPGYILVGNILNFLANLPWGVSLVIVIAVSTGFYFLLGLFIDKLKMSDREKKTKLIIWATFSILFLLFIFLLIRNSA